MPRPTSRIPLNTLAVPFGLAGFAETWSYAAPVLHLPAVVPQVFWAIAAVVWVWLLGAHAVRGARVGERLVDQLRHPAQGPIAALVPVALHLAWQVGTLKPNTHEGAGTAALARFRANRFAGLLMFLACVVVGTSLHP